MKDSINNMDNLPKTSKFGFDTSHLSDEAYSMLKMLNTVECESKSKEVTASDDWVQPWAKYDSEFANTEILVRAAQVILANHKISLR